ncbi:MAG: UDP-N-acetylmuramate dehydrogenase [Catenisphaera adipataccumulans]|jgi:UDP-N-acetylmuramate dehydrogenase|uniref:UDP-N-acetylmuramate dehydrogenase n=1 Tax=Catenisphaera adipataccumulans TaxID=700500 RepID=UPI003D92B14E
MSVLERLETYARVKEHESMKKHTTFHIGGTVDYFIYPKNCTSLLCVVNILNENHIPYFVMGRGSNVLCDDEDFHGAIINLDRTLNEAYIEPSGILVAQAGCSVVNLAAEAMKHSLSGLEFASGIPGSIGGAVYMNAGAYKSNMAEIIKDVFVMRDNQIVWMDKSELELAYRHSIFQKHKDWTILAARLQLQPADRDEIRDLMDSRRQRRMAAQPLDKPCAGSVFRNPEHIPAWKLVENLGLRGFRIGGAQVSEKHCNFIVNENNEATAADVRNLIALIKEKAKNTYDIDLITEVEQLHW